MTGNLFNPIHFVIRKRLLNSKKFSKHHKNIIGNRETGIKKKFRKDKYM